MLRRSVVLSGFMATGKTTIGRLAAGRLRVPFVDTDELVAARAGATIPEIFAREGEARFREREAEVVLSVLADAAPRVVALGGGAVTTTRVRHAALEAATVVTLSAAPETIVARAASIDARPNLRATAPLERARDLLALRREAYGECHATIDTDAVSPEAAAHRIADLATRDLLAAALGSRSYAIELTDGRPDRLAEAVAELAPSSLVVVTDENVHAARGAWLERALAGFRGPRVDVVIRPGEPSKTLATISRIWDEALRAGVDRDALVLAFGGGVVGDLAGFAASTLLRGVRCMHIATSLLAMVDSSVGGKTGFDHPAGKNLVGAFFQPSRVVLDLEHLTTLPARERAAGLAEVVKIALVRDAAILGRLESHAEELARGDRGALLDVVRDAVVAKIRVVRDDEREAGVRALLNLGHTIGHALEAHGGYATLLHGEAVAVGTVLELAACERLGLTPEGTSARAAALLARLGLPVRAPAADVEAAWPFVLSDKKRMASSVKLPVVASVGDGRVVSVALDALRTATLDVAR